MDPVVSLGTTVVVQGLVKDSAWNGKVGIIRGRSVSTGRWAVETGGRILAAANKWASAWGWSLFFRFWSKSVPQQVAQEEDEIKPCELVLYWRQ